MQPRWVPGVRCGSWTAFNNLFLYSMPANRNRSVSAVAEVQTTALLDVSMQPSKDAAEVAGGSSTPGKKKPSKPKAPSMDHNNPELQAKAARLVKQLAHKYPDPPIPLDHTSTFQLLIAVVLSAQTTDVKVNETTPALFAKYPDPASLAKAEVTDVANIIRFLGLGPTKAKNIVALSKDLMELHGGQVPDTWDALEALPGVGHKTASVVMAQAFGKDAFPVDTHIHRLAQRWGLTDGSSVEQTEADLKALLPVDTWKAAHLQIIYFGREHCPAVGHDPSTCPICSWAAVPPYDKVGCSPARPGKKPSSRSLSVPKGRKATDLAAELEAAQEAAVISPGSAPIMPANKRKRKTVAVAAVAVASATMTSLDTSVPVVSSMSSPADKQPASRRTRKRT